MPHMITSSQPERGAVATSTLVIVALSVFALLFAGLSVWAYVNYMDQKNNVDSKIGTAVTEAEKNLGDKLEADSIEREKEPLKSFTGPSDYGSLGFKYPKTWNTYVSNDGSRGNGYEAFFSPGSVPSIDSSSSRYALHVTTVNEDYEDVTEANSQFIDRSTGTYRCYVTDNQGNITFTQPVTVQNVGSQCSCVGLTNCSGVTYLSDK